MIVLLISLIAQRPLDAQEETVGVRPYEMDWANRTEDDHPPLVDFEDLTGWTVEAEASVATFERTREQQLWGKYVGKLTYRGVLHDNQGKPVGKEPVITIRPPEPIIITQGFDAVTLWMYGNNWGWIVDPTTPQVSVHVLFVDREGREIEVYLQNVNWQEWFVMHRRLSLEQIEALKGGARFAGFRIRGGRNEDNRLLYFDNLAVFTEEFAPLTFKPRPKRGIDMFPGQGLGTNTGPGRLPFPTRKETILPAVLTPKYKIIAQQREGAFRFTYAAPDASHWFEIAPKTGTFGDITVGTPDNTFWMRPCVEGGVYFATPQGAMLPERVEHLGTEAQTNRAMADPQHAAGFHEVVSRWRMYSADRSAEVTYTYRMWGKSLVIDVVAPGGEIAEVRYGHCEGATNPRLVTLPFYPMGSGQNRPAIMVSDTEAGPLFLMSNTCWYLSNASLPYATNEIKDGLVTYNGGVRYIPKTDGKRNDVYERFFLTISHRFEEVLPTIANPESPWKHITGTHVWRAHGASNRERDAEHWRRCHRYGMIEVVITDHETGWRDGGESFTFRTRPAPGKGGEKGQYDYARLMQDELGFVYGPYNNYTDFAPVNEYWSIDRVSRTPDNQLQRAWPRCYAPKPAIAVEFCEMLAPKIEEQFHFSTAYCDVHTAVAPWDRVDYDYRVPGAGTFAAVFYSYGEIMLLQKKAWDGPVYSEGNNHAFYCGLTDGNYGQDQRYGLAENPWLVDFDLRKMHDLCCNFGMGNPEMFFSGKSLGDSQEDIENALDRFLCATVAFGHPGFLVLEYGQWRTGMRSYYMLQQLHSRYCLASVDQIRYVDEGGRLLDTSAAVATGAYKRSQLATRYTDGTVTITNGHPFERMKVKAFGREVDLPPNGYAGWTADGAIEVYSGDRTGHRSDYAVSPAYLFVDGRGHFARHPKAAGNGPSVCRKLGDGKYEIIPYQDAACGFAIGGATAVALNEAREEIGPAEIRVARGLTYVMPVEGAFSYLLTKGPSPEVELTCNRDIVVGGETVTVQGRQRYTVTIPVDVQPGERLWFEFDNAWIDFTVAPLADVKLSIENEHLIAYLTSNLARPVEAMVTLKEVSQRVTLSPGKPMRVALDLGHPTREDVEVLRLQIAAGPHPQTVETVVETSRGYRRVAELPDRYETGMCLRGGKETNDWGNTLAYVAAGDTSCGNVTKRGFRAHPPYVGGVGYSFVLYETLQLPNQPCVFRAWVGKGDGSDLGDGILYKVEVVDADGNRTVVGQRLVATHTWLPLEADLTPWAGQEVRLKMIADVGEAENSVGDWACWADLRIESPTETLTYALAKNPERYRRERGPYPVKGLTIADLRNAIAGAVHYDGIGLEGGGQHYTKAVLNDIELGNMTPAGGSETAGVWAEDVSVPLTREAIATLGRRNSFRIENPGRDWFKVRRFWVKLTLADGRKCSSDIAAVVFTQPPTWPYAEGIKVPHGQDITVDIWFDVKE